MNITDIRISAIQVLDLCHKQLKEMICIVTVTEMVHWTSQAIDCNEKEQKVLIHLTRYDSFQKHRANVQKKLPKLCGFPPVLFLERSSLPCKLKQVHNYALKHDQF